MNQERFSGSKPVTLIDAGTALAATVTGNSIDTRGFNSLTATLDIAITAGSVDSVKFQESSDNGVSDAWADVADDTLFYPGSFPVSATGLLHVGSVAKERYVRIVVICTGPTGTIGSAGFLQDAEAKPPVKESSTLADSEVISPDKTADAVTTHPKRTV